MTTTLPTAPSLRDLLALGIDPAPFVGGIETMLELHNDTAGASAAERAVRSVELAQRAAWHRATGQLCDDAGFIRATDPAAFDEHVAAVQWRAELLADERLGGILVDYLRAQIPTHPRADEIADAGTWQAIEVAALTALEALRNLADLVGSRVDQGATAIQTTESARALDAVARVAAMLDDLA